MKRKIIIKKKYFIIKGMIKDDLGNDYDGYHEGRKLNSGDRIYPDKSLSDKEHYTLVRGMGDYFYIPRKNVKVIKEKYEIIKKRIK